MRTRTMTALVLLAAAGLASCVKLHEEVETETLKHQQTEIETLAVCGSDWWMWTDGGSRTSR